MKLVAPIYANDDDLELDIRSALPYVLDILAFTFDPKGIGIYFWEIATLLLIEKKKKGIGYTKY